MARTAAEEIANEFRAWLGQWPRHEWPGLQHEATRKEIGDLRARHGGTFAAVKAVCREVYREAQRETRPPEWADDRAALCEIAAERIPAAESHRRIATLQAVVEDDRGCQTRREAMAAARFARWWAETELKADRSRPAVEETVDALR